MVGTNSLEVRTKINGIAGANYLQMQKNIICRYGTNHPHNGNKLFRKSEQINNICRRDY